MLLNEFSDGDWRKKTFECPVGHSNAEKNCAMTERTMCPQDETVLVSLEIRMAIAMCIAKLL